MPDSDSVTRQIRDFTVALGLDVDREDVPTTSLIGSGTLVTWKGKLGILTASHVIEVSRLREASTLRLGGGRHQPDVLELDIAHLGIHTIGQYDHQTAAKGPDLAVIELAPGDPTTQSLRSKKSFYSLDIESEERTAEVIDGQGEVALAGTLGETRIAVGVMNGVSVVRHDGFVGYSPRRTYFVADDFDYFDVSILYNPPALPESYGGMSGGGLWKIPPLQQATKTSSQPVARLAGVNFYQSPEVSNGNEGRIRCHGPLSIYKVRSLL